MLYVNDNWQVIALLSRPREIESQRMLKIAYNLHATH